MKLHNYVRVWMVITALISFECIALNYYPQLSFLKWIQANGLLNAGLDLSPQSGRPVSLYYGWAGMGTMLLTNFYIARKRLGFFKKSGNMAGWLNFHIFCGLLGPTLILFHTNFKIGGLVAMSFWSMVVSFSSGVIGRYFYVQLLGQKSDYERALKQWDLKIKQIEETSGNTPALLEKRQLILAMAGAGPQIVDGSAQAASIARSILNSMVGDLWLKFGLRKISQDYPRELREAVVQYAVTQRRLIYLEPFRKVMGYWHSFHTPFAIFMYMIAIIHIATALLLHV